MNRALIVRLRSRLAIAVLLTALCSSAPSATVATSDAQLWSELDATHNFAHFSATGIVTARLANNLPNPALTAEGLQLDYRFGSWIASATGYYVSVRSPETGAHTTVWLPAAAISYQIDVGHLRVADRNRLEQLEGVPGAPTRYRNRASVNWHIAYDRESPEIFASDEVFYDFSRDHWTRNRAEAGVQFFLDANMNLQVYYLRQVNTYGVLDRLNVLGLTLQLDIK